MAREKASTAIRMMPTWWLVRAAQSTVAYKGRMKIGGMTTMAAPEVENCKGECGSQEEMSVRRNEITMASTGMRRMADT
jgi:hypothetical protein